MTDFCYNRPMLERVIAQTGFMDRMLQHLGIRRVDAARMEGGMGWYEARSRCIGCQNEARCRAWLAEASLAVEAPTFCANAAFFKSCRAGATRGELARSAP